MTVPSHEEDEGECAGFPTCQAHRTCREPGVPGPPGEPGDEQTVREHALRVGAGSAPLRTVLVLAQVHEPCDFCHLEDVVGTLDDLPTPATACAVHYEEAKRQIQSAGITTTEKQDPPVRAGAACLVCDAVYSGSNPVQACLEHGRLRAHLVRSDEPSVDTEEPA